MTRLYAWHGQLNQGSTTFWDLRHVAFMWVTWHVYMCNVMHPFRSLRRLGICVLTNWYVWRDTVTCVTWCIHSEFHDVLVSVAWRIHMCDVTRSHVWHGTLIQRSTSIDLKRNVTHTNESHDTHKRVMSHISELCGICVMTNSNTWHDLFICVTWFIQSEV